MAEKPLKQEYLEGQVQLQFVLQNFDMFSQELILETLIESNELCIKLLEAAGPFGFVGLYREAKIHQLGRELRNKYDEKYREVTNG